MAPSSKRALVSRHGKLTKHDERALSYIQMAENAVDAGAIEAAEAEAIKMGSQETYRRLFKTFHYKGLHILHYAVKYAKLPLCVQLVNYLGLDINLRDRSGLTALHYAMNLDSETFINLLINTLEATVDIPDNVGSTTMHLSVFIGKHKALKALLDNQANANSTFFYGKAIHAAVALKDIRALELLLPHVDINDVMDLDTTPIHTAGYFGSLQCFERLLKEGSNTPANLISKIVISGHPAAEPMVRLLLDRNLDANTFNEDFFEDLPIISVAKRRNTSLVTILINHSDPIPEVLWTVDGIFAYIDTDQFKMQDGIRTEERVKILRQQLMAALNHRNYLMAEIYCIQLRNDLPNEEFTNLKDLCQLCDVVG